MGLYAMDAAVGGIGLSAPYFLTCYWPWLKNYYGEVNVGRENFNPMAKTLWIDQDLKEDLGY
jgi:peptide/nickel transport system substrate-binding protein